MSADVVILQRVLADYRLAFFDALAEHLHGDGRTLAVYAGQSRSGECLAQAADPRPYLHRVVNRYLAGRCYWQQGVFRESLGAGLVIFEQASTALCPYAYLLRRMAGARHPKIAFWGHGRDFSRANPGAPAERWKRFWTKRCDFWFAYSEAAAMAVRMAGVPEGRIAVVNNASDTRALAAAVETLSAAEKDAVFASLWGEPRRAAHRVAVFCGRLMPAKGLENLLDAGGRIHLRLPDFRLLVIGDGPLRGMVERFAAGHSWCACPPSAHGAAKAPLLAQADLWLHPGTAGLAITDAFACGLPFVTVERHDHGPERAYLNASNAVVSDPAPEALAGTVVELFLHQERLASLREGARAAGKLYSVEGMAERFAAGIRACLEGTGR